MSAPRSTLRRARRPDGAARWVARETSSAGEAFFDLGSADGLANGDDWGEGLVDAAALLCDPPAWEARVAAGEPVDAAGWPLLQPGRPGKGLALGKNFAAHAREFGAEPPEELVWFAKLPDVLAGPGAEVRIPSWLDTRVDPEAEIVLLVGKPLANASEAEAAAAIAAYTLGNDVTARKVQGLDKDRGWPWLRCKNVAGFGPFGPEWTPASSIEDLSAITLRGLVNGEVRQEASLADFLWPPAPALAEISRWCPLAPGDLVFLGTPAGVAAIHPGDVLVVEAEGLGRLENAVVAG